ncbi:MAG: hypothetical protein V7L01_19695 [Nostoc sp.]
MLNASRQGYLKPYWQKTTEHFFNKSDAYGGKLRTVKNPKHMVE